MANSMEESWELVQQVQRDFNAYVGIKALESPDHIADLLASFRSASQDLLLWDFEFANSKGVENRLWDAHGKINGQYRKQLRHMREKHGKKKTAEQRNAEKHFLNFIKSSQRYYRGHIQFLGARFQGIKELEAVANRMTLSTLSAEEPVPADGNLRCLLVLSCHQALIRLGDLSRWRETQLETKDRNWGPAIGYYDLAARIHPASGTSDNQLAVIALVNADHLRAVYHLYRAIAIEEPHPNAKDNLEVEFKKIEELWSLTGPNKREAADDTELASFLQLHAHYYKGVDFPKCDELEDNVLGHFKIGGKEQWRDGSLLKMVLINVAAEYFAGQRLRDDPKSIEILQSFRLLQRLNVRSFSTLLQTLQLEMKCYIDRETSTGTDTRASQRPKISVTSRQVLPALRQYSSWLIANSTILAAGNGDDTVITRIKELWKIYSKVLTLLASLFSVAELQTIEIGYLLEEDEDTLAFLPFRHEDVSQRYLQEDSISQKPRHHDENIERHHPNIEMMARIRCLLMDGMILHLQEDVPIHLVENGQHFVYLEDGISIPFTELEKNEETKLAETSLPLAHSLASSAHLPMDVDPQRMVDDLVGPEIGDQQDIAVNPLGIIVGEETSYGLLGSSTVLEHFGQDAAGSRRSSRPLLPSIENSPFALQPDEEQLLASPLSPTKQRRSGHAWDGSREEVPHQQQPKQVFISSSISSVPTPTFQDTNSELGGRFFNRDVRSMNPGERAKNVQKALDEAVFVSSNIFSEGTTGNASNG